MIFEYIYLMLHRSHFDWLLSQFNRDRHVQAEASLKVRFLIYERAVKDCVASTIGFWDGVMRDGPRGAAWFLQTLACLSPASTLASFSMDSMEGYGKG
jgi:hypothetical protein